MAVTMLRYRSGHFQETGQPWAKLRMLREAVIWLRNRGRSDNGWWSRVLSKGSWGPEEEEGQKSSLKEEQCTERRNQTEAADWEKEQQFQKEGRRGDRAEEHQRVVGKGEEEVQPDRRAKTECQRREEWR